MRSRKKSRKRNCDILLDESTTANTKSVKSKKKIKIQPKEKTKTKAKAKVEADCMLDNYDCQICYTMRDEGSEEETKKQRLPPLGQELIQVCESGKHFLCKSCYYTTRASQLVYHPAIIQNFEFGLNREDVWDFNTPQYRVSATFAPCPLCNIKLPLGSSIIRAASKEVFAYMFPSTINHPPITSPLKHLSYSSSLPSSSSSSSVSCTYDKDSDKLTNNETKEEKKKIDIRSSRSRSLVQVQTRELMCRGCSKEFLTCREYVDHEIHCKSMFVPCFVKPHECTVKWQPFLNISLLQDKNYTAKKEEEKEKEEATIAIIEASVRQHLTLCTAPVESKHYGIMVPAKEMNGGKYSVHRKAHSKLQAQLGVISEVLCNSNTASRALQWTLREEITALRSAIKKYTIPTTTTTTTTISA